MPQLLPPLSRINQPGLPPFTDTGSRIVLPTARKGMVAIASDAACATGANPMQQAAKSAPNHRFMLIPCACSKGQ
ncbi:MAG: hypothetical protein WAU68_07165 [Vitreimonas sp.]